ncbi:MAG: putative O-glycosylation ligase, exosortase A system-associated [Planctomycetes bacterium]|nr:putative O-glycosylation ligase, exosortase A system-associated [Planctomycetota bacterium]
MRDIVFSLVIAILLPVCFRRPLIGLLSFSWLAYMRTQDLCWGFAREQRWSFLIAGVMLAGHLARSGSKWLERDLRSTVMILLTIWVGLSVLYTGSFGPTVINFYIEYCKIIIVALFTAAVVIKREHLRVLMWVIALSFGFYGVKVGLSGVLSLGRIKVLQGPGGMLEDNNNFGLALCMGLPLLIQIALAEKNRILKRGFVAMIPLTVLTIILTHSRGAFLTLCAVGAALIWRSRNRVAGFMIVGLGGLTAIAFVDRSYIDRLSTIQNFEADGSAMGRLAAWKTALNMAEANPVFGVGYGMFQQNYWKYASGAQSEGRRVAHNAYLQILAECGLPAFCLYMTLIVLSFWSLWRIRRRAQQAYYASWILEYATMFEASMVAFVVGSTFLNRAQFDLFYHFVAIILVFERIAMREMDGLVPDEGPRSHGGELKLVEARGFQRAAGRNGFVRGTLQEIRS